MDKLLTADQVAEILQVKKSTMYSLVCRKRIPHLKLTGKILRFKLSELQRWIESANYLNTASNYTPEKAKSQPKSKNTISIDQIDRLIQQARIEVLSK